MKDGDANAMERVLGSVTKGDRLGSYAPLEVLVLTVFLNSAYRN